MCWQIDECEKNNTNKLIIIYNLRSDERLPSQSVTQDNDILIYETVNCILNSDHNQCGDAIDNK